MPKVSLKVSGWLCQNLNIEPANPDEIPISVPEGESILGMVRHLSEDSGVFLKTIFGKINQEIGISVLVILNGRIVNPYNQSEGILKEGDKVTFLPMMDGG